MLLFVLETFFYFLIIFKSNHMAGCGLDIYFYV